MSSRIEDYSLIGDCETAALGSKEGSIDWLCWPRFDSGACFAALLGGAHNGRWRIAPVVNSAAGTEMRVTRRYRKHTLIVETEFANADGAVVLIDFMPLRGVLAVITCRASGRGEARHSGDAHGIDPAVRLWRVGALGFSSRERRPSRDRRAGHGASAHAKRA
ncbi:MULTISPECIES: trehalase-like domain-containing protein [Bradyrhizobium]|uniref:trehalase-like domain-containing protein n=1 Tax=Bradyrhizobium elkanii TaxID=29448 RepID=UPI0032E4845E